MRSAHRVLPELDPWTEPFWTGGREDALRLPRCPVCARWFHPSETVCPDHPDVQLAWAQAPGTGSVIGVTVDVQVFLPGFVPPYAIAIVALDGTDGVRLTTNVVDVDPYDVHVGQRVSVVFTEQDGVWFPLFAPLEQPDDPLATEVPLPLAAASAPPPLLSGKRPEDSVAITGIGMSQVGRRLMRPPVSLTVEACRAAVQDAGLTMDDIDGLTTWPGGLSGGGGITEGGVPAVQQALGVTPSWHNGGLETAGQTGAVAAAILAVASGLCRHVLCFRTVWEATHTDLLRTGRLPLPSGGRIGGDFQYRIPFGASSASNFIGMLASQYLARFGVDRTVLGRIAVNDRTNAGRNPVAVYRDPITMDDYFAARTVSTPFGLYDCDVPCDGSIAIVVSALEAADDSPRPTIRVEAMGTRVAERQSWDQATVTHLTGIFGPAQHLWSRTSLTPADVDVAELYDGFSFNCLSWLEALGFCEIGAATDFVGDGSRIALDGALPLNTHGGQLSAGRTHGFGFVHEAVLQLRGEAGDRQVPGARVAAVGVGGGIPGGCFLLRTD